VYQLDDLVRKSIDILEQKGYMKNSLFVLYGDHGEGFREHGLNQHYNHLYQEMIHVPLIFHSSQGKLDIDKRFGTLEDILPTVLDMVDLPVPDEVGGVSLRDPPAQRITYHDSRKGIYAVMQVTQTEMFKLIREKNGDVFLYDITEDPGEKIDVKDRFPEKTTILLAKLKQRFEIE
jgi:lipoteichoic acid synthase